MLSTLVCLITSYAYCRKDNIDFNVTSNINPVLFTDKSIKKFIQSIGDWFAKIQIHRIITVDGTLIENF